MSNQIRFILTQLYFYQNKIISALHDFNEKKSCLVGTIYLYLKYIFLSIFVTNHEITHVM